MTDRPHDPVANAFRQAARVRPMTEARQSDLAAAWRWIRHSATCALQAVRDNAPDDELCTCGLREFWQAATLTPTEPVASLREARQSDLAAALCRETLATETWGVMWCGLFAGHPLPGHHWFEATLTPTEPVASLDEALPNLPSHDYDPRMGLQHRWFSVEHVGHPGVTCSGPDQRAFEALTPTEPVASLDEERLARAKGPVVGWRFAAALRALHDNGLAYEEQPEGVRAAIAEAARLATDTPESK